MERIELELDPTTTAYLLQRCVRRGDLAGAASEALRELALRESVTALEHWHEVHPDYAELADRETAEALADAS